jgi:hypothetical protein
MQLHPWTGSKTKLCIVSLHGCASAPVALRCVWGQGYLCLGRMLFSSASTSWPPAWRKGLLRSICRAESRPVKTELHLRPEQHLHVNVSSLTRVKCTQHQLFDMGDEAISVVCLFCREQFERAAEDAEARCDATARAEAALEQQASKALEDNR